MACFLVPMGLAILTTAFSRKFPEKLKVSWLNALLWGGVLMLAIEHLAHGEIVPYPPFLTAGIHEVLPEMLTVGVPMTFLILAVWSGMVLVDLKIAERARIGPRLGVLTRK
ncbi:MAG: hypothetical protein QXH26_01060 [Candidatus Hadarchaeales archaeon]